MTSVFFKSLYCLLFLTSVTYSSAQDIFSYEKEISNKQNYNFENIHFENPDKKVKVVLNGTLITPKADYDKVIIIMPGTGMDTRNSHYKLTEELLNNNIAVFRYDDRGTGSSGGVFSSANYTIPIMAADLVYAYNELKNNTLVKDKKIGFIGHSQGGLVTMSAYNMGIKPDFIVLWSVPVQKHGEFIKHQLITHSKSFDEMFTFQDLEKRLAVVTALHNVVIQNLELDNWKISKKLDKEAKKIGYGKKDYVRFPYLTFVSQKEIVRINFEEHYKNFEIPLLYIIGDKDTFVDPVAETQLLESFANKNITIIKKAGLNHYLTSDKILTTENMYTIDSDGMSNIINWIKKV